MTVCRNQSQKIDPYRDQIQYPKGTVLSRDLKREKVGGLMEERIVFGIFFSVSYFAVKKK